MFHCFGQNNSGGSFDYDEHSGISHFVIIEGDDRKEIMNRAEDIGIYFDGCESGMDCPCCGDRWYAAWGSCDLDEEPLIYGEKVEEYKGTMKWINGYEVFVHYKDGTVKGYWK